MTTSSNLPGSRSPSSLEMVRQRSSATQFYRMYAIALLIVLLFVVQKFWYFRLTGAIQSDTDLNAAGAIYLRYLCWLMIIIGHAITLPSGSLIQKHQTSLWMYGLLAYGLAMSIVAGRFSDGIQGILMQTIVMSAAVLITSSLNAKTIFKYTFYVLCFQVFISVAIALGDPTSGIVGEGSRTSWRGGFIFKVGLGITCAYCILMLYIARGSLNKFISLSVGALLLVTIINSDSAGALLAALLAIIHYQFLRFLDRLHVSRGAWYIFVFCFYSIAILFGSLMLTVVLDFLGRDLTLTGRTEIWAFYSPKIMDFWAWGAGPGAFSGPSEFTAPYATYWPWLGIIQQPHSTYLQMIGDVGIFGLLLYGVMLFQMIFVIPNQDRSVLASTVSSLALILAITGGIETFSPFVLNPSLFIVILFYCAWRQARISPRNSVRN